MEQIGTPQYSYILPAKINQPIYDANPSTNYMTTTETAQYQTVSIPTQLISTVPLVNTTPQPQVPLPIPTVSLIQTPQPIIQQLPSPQPVVTTQPISVSQVPQVPQVPVMAQPENHFVSNYPIYEDDPRRSVLRKSIFDTSALGYNPDDFRSRITLPQLAFTEEYASTLGTTTGTNLPPVTTSTALPAVSTTLPDISTTLPPVTTLTPGVATSLAGTVDNMANISGLNTLNNISTGLSDKLNTGVNNVTSGIGNVADSVNNAATGLGNTVKDGINDIKNIF